MTKNNEKLILMFKDEEVLAFNVDYSNERIMFLEKLDGFNRAPYGISEDGNDINAKLISFFMRRTIAPQRSDYEKILNATDSKSGFDFSFKGHGLSLSNHYWFKRDGENLRYSDINFFTNKWDDSFARAILKEDYEALKHCDLNVPDIVTPGWGVKGWIYDNGPKLYKLGIHADHPDEAICEVLASKLAKRMFDSGEVTDYELKKVNGKYASISSCMIDINEEMVSMHDFLPPELGFMYLGKDKNKSLGKKFFEKVAELGLPDIYNFFVKLTCFRTLCFISDLHFGNISVIRNLNDGSIRVAPLYDLGGAFGSSKTGKQLIANANSGLLLMIYYLFGDLDPSWDYSWYDPNKLVGFEDEIREYLSKSEFYTPQIIETVIDVYHQQKKTLDDMIKRKD